MVNAAALMADLERNGSVTQRKLVAGGSHGDVLTADRTLERIPSAHGNELPYQLLLNRTPVFLPGYFRPVAAQGVSAYHVLVCRARATAIKQKSRTVLGIYDVFAAFSQNPVRRQPVNRRGRYCPFRDAVNAVFSRQRADLALRLLHHDLHGSLARQRSVAGSHGKDSGARFMRTDRTTAVNCSHRLVGGAPVHAGAAVSCVNRTGLDLNGFASTLDHIQQLMASYLYQTFRIQLHDEGYYLLALVDEAPPIAQQILRGQLVELHGHDALAPVIVVLLIEYGKAVGGPVLAISRIIVLPQLGQAGIVESIRVADGIVIQPGNNVISTNGADTDHAAAPVCLLGIGSQNQVVIPPAVRRDE